MNLKIISKNWVGWFGLWCLMPLSTIFQLYRGGHLLYFIILESTMSDKGRVNSEYDALVKQLKKKYKIHLPNISY
jgi:hypothetical protein